jgi:hypothetical protein
MTMTGQIPKYGEHFRLESTPYHPVLANRVYALKKDPAWFVRSDKTSKKWRVYCGVTRDTAVILSPALPTLSLAMARLLGTVEGFYS